MLAKTIDRTEMDGPGNIQRACGWITTAAFPRTFDIATAAANLRRECADREAISRERPTIRSAIRTVCGFMAG
jgi:hypothetical protein